MKKIWYEAAIKLLEKVNADNAQIQERQRRTSALALDRPARLRQTTGRPQERKRRTSALALDRPAHIRLRAQSLETLLDSPSTDQSSSDVRFEPEQKLLAELQTSVSDIDYPEQDAAELDKTVSGKEAFEEQFPKKLPMELAAQIAEATGSAQKSVWAGMQHAYIRDCQ